MKHLLVAIAAILLVGIFGLGTAVAQTHVRGYYKSDGTYVAPHYRSNPNSTVRDNYSYKGNVNPYTGKTGTNYYRHSRSSQYYHPRSRYTHPRKRSSNSLYSSGSQFKTQKSTSCSYYSSYGC